MHTTLKILALLHIAVIFFIVPYARDIQAILDGFVQGLGISYLSILLFFFLLFFAGAIGYYGQLKKAKGRYYTIIHAILLILTTVFAIHHVGEILVEYTHILTYAVLYVLVRLSFHYSNCSHSVAKTLVLSNCVSLIDELLQAAHPTRVFDLRDLTLNFLGALVGLLLVEPLLKKSASSQASVAEVGRT